MLRNAQGHCFSHGACKSSSYLLALVFTWTLQHWHLLPVFVACVAPALTLTHASCHSHPMHPCYSPRCPKASVSTGVCEDSGGFLMVNLGAVGKCLMMCMDLSFLICPTEMKCSLIGGGWSLIPGSQRPWSDVSSLTCVGWVLGSISLFTGEVGRRLLNPNPSIDSRNILASAWDLPVPPVPLGCSGPGFAGGRNEGGRGRVGSVSLSSLAGDPWHWLTEMGKFVPEQEIQICV